MTIRAKIQSTFIRTSISNDANIVYSAVRSGLRSLQRVPFELAVGGEHSSHHVFCYPIESLQGFGYQQKIVDLLTFSIGQKLKIINDYAKADRIKVHIVLPNTDEPDTDSEYVVSALLDYLGAGPRFKLSTSYANDGVLRALDQCVTNLEDDECDHVFFGGVDSLINLKMIHAYAQNNRLLTDKLSDGIGLGEGLAFIHLVKADHLEDKLPKALINSIAYIEEPENGKAERAHLTGLANSVKSLLEVEQLQPRDIHTIIHNYGGDISSVYERNQFIHKLWPSELPEDLRVAIQLGEIEQADNPNEYLPEEICPAQTLGELGAASVPIQLSLTTGAFKCANTFSRFGIPAARNMLVCESNNTTWRGALCLTNPSQTKI